MDSLEFRDGVLLRDADRIVAYHRQSMEIFNVEIDRSFGPGLSLDRMPDAVHAGPDDGQPASPVSLLSGRDAVIPIMLGRASTDLLGYRPAIHRLTLNISNACNLWCSYCYADHGLYHSPKSFLAPATGVGFINKIMEMYSGVAIVQYFGGEPLMNLPAINAIGERFEEMFNAGLIQSIPKFVATTNGTISSRAVLDTLKRWGIELTVSWDGPKHIQDSGRPMVGKGSGYDKLVRSLARFDSHSIPYSIECTYNATHYRSGISVVDLMRFFWEHAGQRIVHIAPASTPVPRATKDGPNGQRIFTLTNQDEKNLLVPLDKLVDYYREASRVSVENFLSADGPMLDFAYRVIERLITKSRSTTYCPAFFNQLSIATDGAVYPCFMFIGDPRFNLGNILSDEFPTQNGSAVFQRYFSEFGLDPVGTNRWYRDLYSGCVAGDYVSMSDFSHRYLEPLHEGIIEECIFGLASAPESSKDLSPV